MNPVTEVKTNPNASPEGTNGGKAPQQPPTGEKGTNLTFGATAGMPGRFKGNFDYDIRSTEHHWRNTILEALGFPVDQPYPRNIESKIDLSSVGSRFIAQGDIRYRTGGGDGTIAEFLDGLSKYSLWGLEEKITCPYLNVGGQGEGQLAIDGQKFYDKLTCPKAQHIIATTEGGEAHCGVNNESLSHQIGFDWLDDVFK